MLKPNKVSFREAWHVARPGPKLCSHTYLTRSKSRMLYALASYVMPVFGVASCHASALRLGSRAQIEMYFGLRGCLEVHVLSVVVVSTLSLVSALSLSRVCGGRILLYFCAEGEEESAEEGDGDEDEEETKRERGERVNACWLTSRTTPSE